MKDKEIELHFASEGEIYAKAYKQGQLSIIDRVKKMCFKSDCEACEKNVLIMIKLGLEEQQIQGGKT